MAKRARIIEESDDEFDPEPRNTANGRTSKKQKRREEQEDERGEDFGNESGIAPTSHEAGEDDSYFGNAHSNNNLSMKKLEKAFVRALLGLEFKYQILTKTMIKNIYEAEEEPMIVTKWKNLYPQLNTRLEEVFGMKLIPLEPKKKLEEDNQKSKSKQQQGKNTKKKSVNELDYILSSTIPGEFREVMFKTMQQDPSVKQGQYTDILDEIRSHANSFNIPKPSSEVVAHGIKMLVVTLIALSEGFILKQQLFTLLSKKFGFDVSDNHVIEELGNITMSDFLDQLAKQEYINQTILKTSENERSGRLQKSANTNHNLVQITIGRRLKAELPRDAFLSMLQDIYGSDWSDETLKSALFTLNNVYGSQSIEEQQEQQQQAQRAQQTQQPTQ